MGQPRIASPFAGLTRDSWLLALASLFADISTEMLYPVLPIYLTQTSGRAGSSWGRSRASPMACRI